ncbi:MAG: hypothetical protein M4D80_12140 [Myxococcota bacterium]|nr:hypothetical protein [Deltaproteobacteria bacterium]MDQ3335910.1 hypothetical protein [Myxococcota bacterium]
MKWLLALLVPSLAAAEVKLDDAAQTITDAIAKIDLKLARFGETLSVETIAALDPSKPVDTKTLRANLAKQKLKVIDDRTYGNATVITIQAANGARARITVDQGGGAITLTARPANPTLPGKCVAIPDVKHPVYVNSSAINQSGDRGRGQTFWDYKTERIHDVDGDGIADAFVPVAKAKNACPEEVAFRVFVMRGACGHDLGVIGPGSFQFDAGTAAIDASGFRPFTMEAQKSKQGKRGIPEMTTTVRRFGVKAGKYKQLDSKSTTGVCHHCATWNCSAP